MSTEDRDRLRESLPPLPESVAKARLLVRSAMRDAGWHEDLVEDAQLAVSELVTNAVVHAGTLIGVSVSVGLDLVRVGVTDGSPNLPRTRDYASTAGTGRGLHLLAGLVTAWGVASHPEQAEEGKTVWFELGQDRAAAARAGERGWGLLEDFAVEDLLGPVETRRADAVLCGTYVEYGGPATEQPETPVDLLDPPVVLYQAWRQHADALLREHFLATVNQSATYDAVRVHAEASDALALLDAAIPHRARARTAEEALAGAAEASTEPNPNITMTVPHQSISHFATLNGALEEAARIGEERLFLTPPVQPELRQLRQWLCDEVALQAAGGTARPWSPSGEILTVRDGGSSTAWDGRQVTASPRALLAVDDVGCICAVSLRASRILGYSRSDDLLGLRLVAVVPKRFREAHLAGFTLHLLTGGGALLNTPVVVPMLGSDGDETLVKLTVREERTEDARSIFIAELDQPGSTGDSGLT